jgi:hypothetical protein
LSASKDEIDADDWPEPTPERVREVVRMSILAMLRYLDIKPPSLEEKQDATTPETSNR